MFGAAAAIALAKRLNANVEFDIHALQNATWKYELDHFQIPATIRPITSSGQPFWSKLIKTRRGPPAPADWHGGLWRESSFHYDQSFETLATSTYLRGYFQSEKYFEAAADTVRAAFDLNPLLSEAGRSWVDKTSGADTVAVHIRRGDYVSNPKATAVHGVMQADYYARALAMIQRAVPNPRLFVVSDEPETARQLLNDWGAAQFVTGTTMFDDMRLISACRHRIIANSSFSWWGAWLDPRADGITIAPRAWFARNKMLTSYVGDLYPVGWFLT